MRMTCLYFAGVAMAFSAVAVAEEESDNIPAEGNVYYLNVSEASGPSNAWATAAYWSTIPADGQDKANELGGTPSENLNSLNDGFIVPAYSGGFTLRTAGNEWNGRYLQLGGPYYANNNMAIMRLTRSNVTFNNEGLILAGRSRFLPFEADIEYNVSGTVTVTADDESHPALISQRDPNKKEGWKTYDNIKLSFTGMFKGSGNVHTKILSTSPGFDITFRDTTQYCGELTVSNKLEYSATTSIKIETDFPGSISISTNTTLIPASNVTIANLKTFDGAVIDARAGEFTISGSFVHSGSGKIRVIMNLAGDTQTTRPSFISVMNLPEGFASGLDIFEFVSTDGIVYGNEHLICENGKVKFGYVTLRNSDNSDFAKDYQSSMTNGANWSDGLWPTNPLVTYAVIGKSLRTYDSSANWETPTDNFVFKGKSLIIDGNSADGKNCYLVVCNPSFRCDNLILRNNANIIKRRYGESCDLSGAVTVENGISSFTAAYFEMLTLNCELKGQGTVKISSVTGAYTSNSQGKFTITSLSPNFLGSMIVTIPVHHNSSTLNKNTPLFGRNYTILNLTDKLNLGGELPELNRKSFTIENMSRIQPAPDTKSLTLDDPTRGIFINWVGRLYANADQTFTVASPLAVHGTLWKEGNGALVLANPAPTFGANADSDTPDSDATNRTFRIAGGDVKIASADAVNGMDVVFTNGAERLVIGLDSTDETFRSYGVRNTKSSTPFAVEGDVQQIPVVLDFDRPPAAPVTVALLTVKNTCLDSVLSCMTFVKSEAISNWLVSISQRDNEDGTTTLVATVKKYGTRITIR